MRKRKEFLAQAAGIALDSLPYWQSVARGECCIPTYDAEGQQKLVYPTHAQMKEAFEIVLRYGIGTSDKVEVEDVTKLTKEERESRLAAKLAELRAGLES